MPVQRGCCARAAQACCRLGSSRVEGEFAAGDAVEVAAGGALIGKGIVDYSAAELSRVIGMKS